MALRIAVQMDPPARLNPHTDSTLMLIEAAVARGHTVYWYDPALLSCEGGVLSAPLAPISVKPGEPCNVHVGDALPQPIAGMDVVLIRQDPPFDLAYITATHLLEQLPAHVRVLNRPCGIRNAPEKLSVLRFGDVMPPTLISRDAQAIHAFAERVGQVVAKPLYGYGGRGVFRFAAGEGNIDTLLEQWGEHSREPLMWQAFLPQVAREDVRVLFINGEVVASFKRIPPQGSIRANMRVGGQPSPHTLSDAQANICARLSPFLRENGLFLAGIDLIGDCLTEINVTCPTGLRTVERLYGISLAEQFWEALG